MYDQRLDALNLANELRQSSDELTRMVRTYVVTGNLRFKEYFQEILDIRNGDKPRPVHGSFIYWDFVVAGMPLPQAGDSRKVSLLELMRQSGLTDSEFDKMQESKTLSDNLARLEFGAMRLIETAEEADIESARAKAIQMLHDENYHQAKAAIMMPIDEFFHLMDARTQAAIVAADDHVLVFRILFMATSLWVVFMILRFSRTLFMTLGGSAQEVHTVIQRIGKGDFTTKTPIESGMESSVLYGLLELQEELQVREVERKESEEELRIAAICFESHDGVMITDAGSVILSVNKAFTDITGYTAEEIVGKTPHILYSGRHSEEFYRDMWSSIARTGHWYGEIWNRGKDGELFSKWLNITAIKTNDGAVTHYIGMLSDISEYRQAQDKIRKLAFFDQLTDLPNRFLLTERLKQVLNAADRTKNHYALLFIDLDNFKSLNDTLGHNMGDLLLKQVAQRLSMCVRKEDTVARLGGDEFVVLLMNLSDNAKDAIAQAGTVCKKIISVLNQSYQLNDSSFRCTSSIGVTLFSDHQYPVENLMKQADLAMYRSKEAGRNTFHFFDPEMETVALKRSIFEKDFLAGIEANQFILYYQAQVTHNLQAIGAEVLLRWQHPHYGMMLPGDFIHLAEETRAMLPLTHWIIETACNQLAKWHNQPGFSHLTIAVNISPQQFRQHDFVDQVLDIVKKIGINPRQLKLELTECSLIHDADEVIDKMSALRSAGVGFSLDDFGVGFSSLSYLKRLPLEQLKIDRSFVRDVLTDSNDASIAKAIIMLAGNLELGVLAEGVETEEQLNFLLESGCYSYQGYLFGKPLPIESFEELVQRNFFLNHP
ncbi:MAG: EAL domain-containing protein [Nitrosomonas sp.]|nr:MAG: EAL domain-containing protein [Nitrosomonas sp.]